jgi:hypothetical protein
MFDKLLPHACNYVCISLIVWKDVISRIFSVLCWYQIWAHELSKLICKYEMTVSAEK